MQLTACVALSIPDNTAQTALATLVRLDFELAALERADLWQFTLDGTLGEREFLTRVARIEAIFNPNKHALSFVDRVMPAPGELWVRDSEERVPADALEVLRQFGPGVRGLRHRTAWRLADRASRPAANEVARRAAEVLLCNPAYQKAEFAAAAKATP